MHQQIEESFEALKRYLNSSSPDKRFAGYDPFDGLNSELLRSLFQYRFRLTRLFWVQFNKRSPVNFRKLQGIKKEVNPQTLGLFLSGYNNLHRIEPKDEYLDVIEYLMKELLSLRSPGWSGDCWGYNFDWQARAFFQPKYTPLVVPTVFCANGLLDAYELTRSEEALNSAISTADFILKDLNRTMDEENSFAFSYSPLDTSVVFNATLLAAELLARLYSLTNNNEFRNKAAETVQYCLKHQQADGSWPYGLKPFHRWIDSFHTGYNLVCINSFIGYTGENFPQESLSKGTDFYLQNFFDDTGESWYYHNKKYPIDINNPAQLIVTLCQLGILKKHRELADRVLSWTIQNMQDKEGYFYYRTKRFFKVRINYMRWSQAWMFYALTSYLRQSDGK